MRRIRYREKLSHGCDVIFSQRLFLVRFFGHKKMNNQSI